MRADGRPGPAPADLFAAHLLLAGLSLLLPLALYQARHWDDNSLTSWQWVFLVVDPLKLWLVLPLLLLLCWLLALAPAWLPGARHRRKPSPPAEPSGPPGSAPPLSLAWAGAGRREDQAPPAVADYRSWPVRFYWLWPAAVAAGCSLLFLDVPEVIVDAARYFIQAKSFSEYGPAWFFQQWGRELFVWTDLPLIPLLYGLLLTIFDQSRLALQLLNVFFFAASAALIAVLGRELRDRETGLAGGLLFLGFPYLYSQVPLLLVDLGTMFFLLLTMVAFIRALRRGGFFYCALTTAAVLAVLLSKYSAWLLLSALAPIGIWSLVLAADRRLVIKRALAALLPVLPPALLLFWVYQDVVLAQLALLLEFQKPGLAGWSESLVSTLLFQAHPWLAVLLLYSLYRAGRLREWGYLILAWPVFLLLVLLEVRRIRYSIPIMPLLALMAAYGLRDLTVPALRRHLLLVIIASSLLLAGGAFLPFLKSMSERNLQEAGAYLDGLPPGEVRVVVLPAPEPVMDPRVAVPLLDLFTRRQTVVYLPVAAIPRPADLATSSLRFTWEMFFPGFYATKSYGVEPVALVLIRPAERGAVSAVINEKLTPYGPPSRFAADSGVFLHRTLVEIYRPASDR